MTRSVRRRLMAASAGAIVAVGAPMAVSAALLWTLTASPLTATTGTATTFTLTATNLDLLTEIGCVKVSVPANFRIEAIGIVDSNAGDSWIINRSGNLVTAQTTSGGDRLELTQWVRFTIRATPLSGGSLAWASNAYRQQDCSGSGSLLGVPPVVVVTGPEVTPSPTPTPVPTPTPTPVPTPTPTPSPTPRPTPTPTPILPLPSLPLPSVPLPSVSLPPLLSTPTPTPTPVPTPSPTATPGTSTPSPGQSPSNDGTSTPDPSPAGEPSDPGSIVGGSPGSGGGGPSSGLTIPLDEGQPGGIGIDLGSIDLLDGIGEWSIPAAFIGGPGLLVLLWVALQTAGTVAWIPAVRRMRGEERAQRARGRR